MIQSLSSKAFLQLRVYSNLSPTEDSKRIQEKSLKINYNLLQVLMIGEMALILLMRIEIWEQEISEHQHLKKW